VVPGIGGHQDPLDSVLGAKLKTVTSQHREVTWFLPAHWNHGRTDGAYGGLDA
jgi:hypothetical protein